jgi:hypothetical protein
MDKDLDHAVGDDPQRNRRRGLLNRIDKVASVSVGLFMAAVLVALFVFFGL